MGISDLGGLLQNTPDVNQSTQVISIGWKGVQTPTKSMKKHGQKTTSSKHGSGIRGNVIAYQEHIFFIS
jgi:hypothetical protein